MGTPGQVPGRIPGSTGAINQPGRGTGTPGQVPGTIGRGGRGPGSVGTPGAIGQPGRGGQGAIGQPGRGGQGQPGRGGQGQFGRGGQGGRGQGNWGPGQARQQWHNNWNHNHGNWNHNGNWNNNNNWGWNNSSFWAGFFTYPLFAGLFNYGYWGFGDSCGAYCSYSPFYYYGMPYVYAPRVVVADVPDYTYSDVPDYSYGNDYYLSQGNYSGLNAALDDIRNAFVNNQPDLIRQHLDANTQIAVSLDNNYAYSLPGSDYSAMVRDAIGHVRTVSFTLDNVQQRSDGAYTATGTHDFYDINNNHKVVNVSFTLAQQGGKWVIVAVGSSSK